MEKLHSASTEATMESTIEIVVINDYNNYFKNWAENLAKELDSNSNNKIKKITVNSGPYRNHGLTYTRKEEVLHLDFYSAVRTGFGSIGITPKEFAIELCT